MTEKLIINCVKYMLRDARPHVVIRLAMLLIESRDQTSPYAPIAFNPDHKLLQNHFKKVTPKEFVADLKALATLSSPEIKSRLILEEDKTQVYEFTFAGIKSYFSLPFKHGRLTIIKKEDKTNQRVEQVWSRWVERIGSRKDVYKKGCSLTTVRKNAIANALIMRSVEDLYDVIEGCLRSPHHMGYTINFKTWAVEKSKNYCCPITIFRNEKIMDGLLSRLNDPMFDIQVKTAKKRHDLRFSTDKANTNKTPAAQTKHNKDHKETKKSGLLQMILNQKNIDKAEQKQ